MTIYSHPEEFGLTTVGEIDWDDGDDCGFNMTVVWKDKDDTFYWADDSGCSCPAPFEDFYKIDELETGSFFDLAKHLERESSKDSKAQVIDVLERLRLRD